MNAPPHIPPHHAPRTTRREILDRIAARLTGLYDEREARSIALLAASELTRLAPSDFLVDPGAPLEIKGLDEAVAQLAAGRPVQYIIGRTEFLGRPFAVREGVLIPRPETEELAAWIVRREGSALNTDLGPRPGREPPSGTRLSETDATPHAAAPLRILDVGTGSGCIAATLAAEMPDAEISAADISPAALAAAAENFSTLGVRVTLRRADALRDLAEAFPGPFDAVVSNPPYVPESDRAAMHVNVRDHEPGEALFVPDDDPLLFYRAIARACRRILRPGGRLYFEIYHLAADAMRQMLAGEGYTDTEVRTDLSGKPRLTCSRKK